MNNKSFAKFYRKIRLALYVDIYQVNEKDTC
ncbi:hypothetical protein NIES267_03490 [Calothrix parasitica NIES-267]|uniref:Uncharacterized protein n=1 Tax=Calothrix parasitica NIES-267 TaxID=1973488 RepID=A0A1Z4LI68_9CYAN|nr:hypothetical protein NIES267_03490 [Calothrix parasitica NIES-267]